MVLFPSFNDHTIGYAGQAVADKHPRKNDNVSFAG
jgi:hypothetical protein